MAVRSKKSGDQTTGGERKPRARTRKKSTPDTAQTEAPDVAQLIGQELERRFAGAVEPVLAGVPDQIMGAIGPALQQLRESMAHVVHEQTHQALQFQSPAGPQTEGEREERSAPSAPKPTVSEPPDNTASPSQEAAAAPEGGPREVRIESREGDGAMTAETNETEQRDAEETDQNQNAAATENRDQEQRPQRSERTQRPTRRAGGAAYTFDAQGAARAGLLNLANTMQEFGAIYQAINAYERILIKYPGTGAADAATEGLVSLAERLQKEGKIYTALNIFTKLEEHLGA